MYCHIFDAQATNKPVAPKKYWRLFNTLGSD
jgi:hypothetical protein